MTTTRRAAANAQNAQKSTGPRTPEGKSVSRFNALKHGVFSREILIPGEDKDALTSLSKSLRAELGPERILEELLVDRITSIVWRLRRLGRIEAGVLSQLRGEILVEREQDEERTWVHRPGSPVARVREAKARLEKAKPTLGLAFINDSVHSDAFSKLARYETSLERSLYRALHELQRLQAARANLPVTPPVALDVDVSHGSVA